MAVAKLALVVLTALPLSSCGFPAWRDQVMRDLMEGRLKIDYSRIGPSGAPSQTVEFYDAGGQHVGYGVSQGGTVNFYNVDGSRAGYGRIGR